MSRLSAIEIWFFVYSIGYSVDKLASIAEHGWSVYAAGLTNGLDAASIPIYIAAFVLRAHSVITNDARASDRAYAILSTAACLLFPRLAFATISNNLLILSLRAMLAEFLYLFGYALTFTPSKPEDFRLTLFVVCSITVFWYVRASCADGDML